MALLAPMASANVRMTTNANPGAWRTPRAWQTADQGLATGSGKLLHRTCMRRENQQVLDLE
jgi:hypothetical protein